MSHSSFMEKLLDGVEMEWKALGKICEVSRSHAPAWECIRTLNNG